MCLRAGCGWWWVPLVAPCIGALVGTLIYELLIEVHHPPLFSETQSSCQETSDNETSDKTNLELEKVEPGGGKSI